MVRSIFFGCCAFIPSRKRDLRKVHDVASVEPQSEVKPTDASFRPQCTCEVFRKNGRCKHIPVFDAFSDTGVVAFVPAAAAILPKPVKELGLTQLPLPLLSGEALERFSWCPDQPLGRGASGTTVLRCLLPRNSNDAQNDIEEGSIPTACAAKVLPLGKSTFPEMIEDFGKEVGMMKSLSRHPSIIAYFGAWRLDAQALRGSCIDAEEAYVLCIELCDACLEDFVRYRHLKSSHFTSAEIAPVLLQVSRALSHLHLHGIMHRDLKSANVFLKYLASDQPMPGKVTDLLSKPLTNFEAKLGDFGSAKAASRASTPAGTPQFMAPEVARVALDMQVEQGSYSLSSDIWAFGCLICEILELGLPYGEDITVPQLEKALLAGHGPSLSDRVKAEQRSQDLVMIMDQCLKEDPLARPTARDLADGLEAFQAKTLDPTYGDMSFSIVSP